MAMDKKRILIVDDAGERYFQAADMAFGFRVMGVDAEVCAVKTATEAIDQLHAWHKNGHKVDLVLHDVTMLEAREQQYLEQNDLLSVDYDTVDRYLDPFRGARSIQMGPVFLGTLLDFIKQELGADFMPDAYFIHSADVGEEHMIRGAESFYGKGRAIDRMEVNTLCVEEYDDYSAFTHISGRTSDLAAYCNDNWGTRFPVDSETCYENGALADHISALREAPDSTPQDIQPIPEPKKVRIRHGVIDLDEAAAAIDNGTLSEAELRELHVNIPSHRTLQYQNIQHYPDDSPLIYGEDGVLGTVCGRLALCEEDILWLTEHHPNDPIILVCERAEHIDHLLPMIQGLAVLKNDHKAMHLKHIAENHGLPYVTGADGRINEDDGLHYPCIRDEKLIEYIDGRFWERGAREWVTLHASDRVAEAYADQPSASKDEISEPQYELYPGQMEIVDHPFPEEAFVNIMGIFDRARMGDNIKVEANADTAEQTQLAIELGAEGIGLNRAENWALGPEAQDRMLKFLLSEDDRYREQNIAWLHAHYLHHFQRNLAVLEQVSTPTFLVNFRAPDLVPHEIMTPEQRTTFFARVGEENSRGVQAALRTKGLYEIWMQAGFEAIDASSLPFHRVRFCAPMVASLNDMIAFNQMKTEAAGGKLITSRAMNERPEFLEVAEALTDHMEGGWNGGSNHLTREITSRDVGRDVRRNDVGAIEEWMTEYGYSGLSPFDSLCAPVKIHFSRSQAITRAANPRMDTSLCGHQMGCDLDSIRFAVTHNFNSISVAPRYLQYARLASGAMANEGLTGSALTFAI